MRYIILISLLILLLVGCEPAEFRPPIQEFDSFVWTRCEDNIVCVSTYSHREMSQCFIDNENLLNKYCGENLK